MINLTRLNGHLLVVNCDLLKFAEASPDTTITLITGEKLVVKESLSELTLLVRLWRSQLFRLAWPDGTGALGAKFALDAQQSARSTPED